ncbi:antigen WC1.1-like [Pteronotus mesoamericanus]|uniref:antigen WC1.1-like n=1 Tax=Pteronotus mesoamericanus TaxID=1884717 RepID=UPI0023EE25AD|nr:antigen WC1.1-like [Pteronotus parnellii mesoamericanus]
MAWDSATSMAVRTRSGLSPGPGIFSLPRILCLILGALLFLVFVILEFQLHRWRVEHRAQRTDTFSDSYDDAEEVPVPKASSASQMGEQDMPAEENGVRASQAGSSQYFPRGAAHPGKEDSPWLLQGEKGDFDYDDVELSASGTSAVAFKAVALKMR